MFDKKKLDPSDSELVVFLGITDTEKIRLILKEICSKFQYKVKLIPSNFDFSVNPGIEINVDKIGVNKDVKVLTFGGLLIDQTNSNLEKALSERLISHEFYSKHKEDNIKLRNLVAFTSNKIIDNKQFIKLVLMEPKNVYVEIQYQLCSGYDDTPGLSLQASDINAFNEYSLLGNVYLMDTQRYKYLSFGEGSIKNFNEWLKLKPKRTEEELEHWIKTKNYEEFYLKKFSFRDSE